MPQPGSRSRATDTAWGKATRRWVQEHLRPGERVDEVVRLRGGWTSEVRRVNVSGPDGERSLVLRSFVNPLFAAHAEGLLTRESNVLTLLATTDIPAAGLIATDARREHCDFPSLLMTLLDGDVRLDDEDADRRADLLACALVAIHRVSANGPDRPRAYQPWTTAEQVELPADTARPELWRRAVHTIAGQPPDHVPCFLHRDFHPGNVLFVGAGDGLRISGVVDWVETSWGPADLDVAHCSTNLALLHGVPAGMAFADRYLKAGGSLAADCKAHLYWRLLDALAFAPRAEKVADPWRELGRCDLTDELVESRLESYIQALLETYG